MAKIDDVETGVEPTKNTDMEDLYSLVKHLSKELETLKNKDKPVTNSREPYTWPRKYSYKMRGWVPVLSYVSKRKDNTKDFLYKRGNEYINNHMLVLTLAERDKHWDYKQVEVDVLDFNRDYTLLHEDNRLEAKEERDSQGNLVGYTFVTEDYGTFTVSPSVLN